MSQQMRTDFGKRMAARRREQRLTQVELAQSVGLTSKAICNIEHGRQWPSMPVYIGICLRLGFQRVPLIT